MTTTLVGTPDPEDRGDGDSEENAVNPVPQHERMPRRRDSKTFSFRVADCHGYVTVGLYDDGRPGEIFLRLTKQGTTLAGVLDAFASAVSIGLQCGISLRAYVQMYINMRFEPAGITADPEIRFASSVIDYVFRRLALEYMPFDERAQLGILTTTERLHPVSDQGPLPGEEPDVDQGTSPQSKDAPYCYVCGVVMQRAGACFVCSSCGTTSGCS